ncbi:hypothetical protein Vadar_013648 [Vaccinium darrowii]|uniref:Uncharacterized protein n=1 Tax=Vaccinium darrowii TaxID=229202 RepID=A0ACB7XRH8_9ERIC|nr:hypothetical protein Vadar_013648 [Vaccinium darrowii]
MIPRLYKAAMEGRIEILNEYIDEFECQLTGTKNTVLHVAVQFSQLDCVKKILEVCPSLFFFCPSLLHRGNCKRETPLHMAARVGALDVVEALINHSKEVESTGQRAQLLWATNLDEDTALHIAVRNGHLAIVSFLTSEDRVYPYPANKAKETPLYLAVERNNIDMVVAILENCSSRDYSGPDGRTALHEAAIIGSPGIASRLLEWKPELLYKQDAQGWTALHYLTLRGDVQGVELLLGKDYLLAHTATGVEDGGKKALHIAAAIGNVSVMTMILSKCPECWEVVDGIGQNVLHVAVDMGRAEVIKFILEMPWSRQLIDQQDNDGNTPLHLLAASKYSKLRETWREYNGFRFTFNNKSMSLADVEFSRIDDDLRWPIVDGTKIVSSNHEKLGNWKVARAKRLEEEDKKRSEEKTSDEKRRKLRYEHSEKMAKTHVIVATIIATTTFAAGFTIPGGYDPNPGSDQGTAILARERSFKVFVLSNTVAVVFSASSVFLYVTASVSRNEATRFAWYLEPLALL